MRKKALPRAIPPPLELECLRALWNLGSGNVAQVREALLGRHALAYTTVMTLLDRLARKGAAERKKIGRYFVYRPAVDRETLRRAAVTEMVDHYFDGEEASMREWLFGLPAAALKPPASVAAPAITVAQPAALTATAQAQAPAVSAFAQRTRHDTDDDLETVLL